MAGFNRAFGESESEGEIDLTYIARVLMANARLIAVVVGVVTLLVLFASWNADSRYRATARIVADTTATGSGSSDTDARVLATNGALLTTPEVLAAAVRQLPGETAASLRDKVSSTVATDADVIDVTATDDSADAAAADANAVARTFLGQRTARARAANLRTRNALTAQLAQVGTGAAAEAQAAAIRTRLNELVVDDANAGSELQLAEAAQPPDGPYAPRPLRNAVLALFVSFFLAALFVVARDRLRPRPEGPDRLERALGVPLIATLSSTGARAAGTDGMGPLLGAVLLALPPGTRHVVLVTSLARDERSAYVAAELARALANAGQETLAVSTDASSAALAQALGVAPAPGLAEALEQAEAGEGVRLRAAAVPGVDLLHVIPSGRAAHEHVGLVRPGAVDAMFAALASTRYEYIVVDAPALLAAREAWLIARNADAAVVACLEHPEAEELAAARKALEALDVRLLGAVATVPWAEPASDPEPAPERTVTAVAGAAPQERPGALELPDRPEGADDLTELAAANGGPAPALEAELLADCLRAADGPLTFSQVREALGSPPATRVRMHLRRLVDDGDVVRSGSGRRGDPYVYGPPGA